MNIRSCIRVICSGAKAVSSGCVISLLISLLLLIHPRAACGDNLFVSQDSVHGPVPNIMEIDSSGTPRTFYSGYGGPISRYGLALDQSDNLYAAGMNIIQLNSSGTETAASYSPGTNQMFAFSLAFDSAGTLFAGDTSGNAIWKFNSAGGTGTVFATLGASAMPQGLAFDSAGNLYVANAGSDPVNPIPPTIEEFGTNGVGKVFASSGLNRPYGLAFDSAGNLYVANRGNNTIEVFDVSGVGKVFADSGLDQPCGLAFGSDGDLYVANYGNGTIEKFISSGGVLSSVGTVFASGLANPEALVFESVPEPSAGLLLGIGLIGLLPLIRRRSPR